MNHFKLWLCCLLCAVAPLAMSGQACEAKAPSPQATALSMAMAQQIEQALISSGTQVAIIARAGQDLSRYGIQYSHAALVFKTKPEQPWTVLHKLNTCGTETAGLYRQGLGNFMLDHPYRYKVLFHPITPERQQTLLKVIAEDRHHWVNEPAYSVIAYPWATDYQNSNGWLLETLALADASPKLLRNRVEAQAHLRRHGYRGTVIHISATERLGANLTRANVSFLDHPLRQRLSGEYEVVSVNSMTEWLTQRGWITTGQALILPAN